VHASSVLRQGAQAGHGAALVDRLGVAQVQRLVLAVDQRHLSAIDLALALGDENAVGQVRGVHGRDLAGWCRAHQVEEASLQGQVMVRMLGEEPCGRRSLLTHERVRRPPPSLHQLTQPPRIVPVDLGAPVDDRLLVRGQVIGVHHAVPRLGEQRGTCTPRLLVDLGPTQQLVPQLKAASRAAA